MRPAIERNDPRAVNHLGRDHDVAGTLEDLKIVVVDRRQVRDQQGQEGQAAARIPGLKAKG